ncbi:MAG: ferredoxin [Dehalococcoidia bacterium]|nr:ferredoxin [Dehalococcoidia bacterium]
MKLSVDRKACIKSGQCTYLHPDLFREEADGYPAVLVDPVPATSLKDAEDSVEVCPGQAIYLKE